jgi:hypothetical protein
MRVGVDAFVWLHQFAASWAHAVAAVGVKDYTGLTAGFMKRALEMLRMGMKPVFVFDGGRAPQKDATNEVQPNKRIHTNPHTSAPDCYRDVLMRELGIRYGLGDPHAMPRSRCALSPRAVCHAACPPATRATTKSDGSLERFAFLSLGRSGSATEIRDRNSCPARSAASPSEEWCKKAGEAPTSAHTPRRAKDDPETPD